MENRRQHYRQALDPTQRLKARFQSPDGTASFAAEIVNLSIGGMCAVLETTATVPDGRWLGVFSLEGRKMQMTVERVYADDERPGHCGFRFLPPVDLERKEENESTIWKFLLKMQRQERRQTRQMTGL
jgi:c-di-GMP-binding flagellar brake protein YcgR